MTNSTQTIQEINNIIRNWNNQTNYISSFSQRCENITNYLNDIETVFDNLMKEKAGVEISPADLQDALRKLRLSEHPLENIKKQLKEAFTLAQTDKTELEQKLKNIDQELNQILADLRDSYNNSQAQIIQLETKIKSNENQAKGLKIKAGLVGIVIGSGIFGLIALLLKFKGKFTRTE